MWSPIVLFFPPYCIAGFELCLVVICLCWRWNAYCWSLETLLHSWFCYMWFDGLTIVVLEWLLLVSGNPIAYLKLLIVLYLGFVMLVAIVVCSSYILFILWFGFVWFLPICYSPHGLAHLICYSSNGLVPPLCLIGFYPPTVCGSQWIQSYVLLMISMISIYFIYAADRLIYIFIISWVVYLHIYFLGGFITYNWYVAW